MSLNMQQEQFYGDANYGPENFADCPNKLPQVTKPVLSLAANNTTVDTDKALLVRTMDGDTKAFDLLVKKYQGNISNVVSRYIQDFDAVKDVVQETFIRAYKALNSYRFESQFYTWLYRIAVNASYNYLKSNRSWMTKVSTQGEDFAYEQTASRILEPELSKSNDELKTFILKAVSSLPIELRTVLLLREREGLNYEQIAETIGCELGTVKSRIFRAREKVIQKTSHLYERQPSG